MTTTVRSLTLILASLAVLASAGCTGGSDNPDDPEPTPEETPTPEPTPEPTPLPEPDITAGTYELANSEVVADECGFGTQTGDLDGVAIEIYSVSETQVEMDFETFPREDDVIGGEPRLWYFIDWTTEFATYGLSRAYDCVEEDYIRDVFTIVGQDAMEFEELLTFTSTAGDAAECIAANTSAFGMAVTNWPCETNVTADLLKASN